MKKSYCIKCQKELSENIKKCDCGSTYFVFGENFHFNENNVECDCGSKNFTSTFHMDHTEKSINNYKCSNCNNLIGTEYYRSKEDCFWGD